MLADLPVLILAGGLGTRLRAALPGLPKGLAPVGPSAFLEIQIRLLAEQGARRFVLCVGHLWDSIQAALGDGRTYGVKIEYSVEEGDRLLGTAGALRLAGRYVAPRAVVLNGDTYFAIRYADLVGHHLSERRRSGVLATLALSHMPEQDRYGTVLLDGSGRHIRAFLEKEEDASGGPAWVSAGAYVLEREVLAYVPGGRPCSLEREVFPAMLRARKRLAAVTFAERFYDIGTPEGLQRLRDYWGGADASSGAARLQEPSHDNTKL